MISVHENVSAHTNRRLSETLDSKTALFSSTNFGEVYLFFIIYQKTIVWTITVFGAYVKYLSSFINTKSESQYRSIYISHSGFDN